MYKQNIKTLCIRQGFQKKYQALSLFGVVDREEVQNHLLFQSDSSAGISRGSYFHVSPRFKPGGRGVWGCAAVMTPFFRPAGTPQPSNLPSMHCSCTPICNLIEKNLHSQPCFWSRFQLSRHKISSEFSLPRPLIFLRKTRSLDPTFENPRGTYSPKKKLSAPSIQALSVVL